MFARGVHPQVHQPGLTADLDSFDLLDLVQVIHLARRDLALVVRADARSLGVLRFSQGELLWAECGELRGEEAFVALATQRAGSIEEHPWDGNGERNVNQPLARLIMQAVGYRDAHEDSPASQAPVRMSRSRPLQSTPASQAPALMRERINGSNGSARQGPHTPPPAPKVLLPEGESVPSWVLEIQSAAEAFSAQPTSSMPPLPPAAAPGAMLRSLDTGYSPAEPLEQMTLDVPEPTIPLSALNGTFSLPSFANGSRSSSQPSLTWQDDPPTEPLPAVQGGLMDYAPKRGRQARDSQREEMPHLVTAPLPDQVVVLRPGSAEEVAAAPVSATPTAAAPVPGESRLSSLSILEQLAYGGWSSNGGAEALTALDGGVPAPSTNGVSDRTAGASLVEPLRNHHTDTHRLDENVSSGSNGALFDGLAPAQELATSASVVPGLSGEQAQSSPETLSAERIRRLERVLETFASQVGGACIATAVIRTDGSLVAEYRVRSAQEQELGSPAYHLAHVMQSSLRALLMGGWGDLEDTMITGSTHSVALRRLGRAEKGLFHVAILERSGNPGLCRVRMRNSEAALLQKM